MKLLALSVLLILCVSGCATHDPKVWYQSGKSADQIRKDWAESQLAAHQAMLHVEQPLVFAENGFAAGMAASSHRDAVKTAKEIAPLTMQSKGYQFVPLSTIPTNAVYLKP